MKSPLFQKPVNRKVEKLVIFFLLILGASHATIFVAYCQALFGEAKWN
jgi:hypothetical protein